MGYLVKTHYFRYTLYTKIENIRKGKPGIIQGPPVALLYKAKRGSSHGLIREVNQWEAKLWVFVKKTARRTDNEVGLTKMTKLWAKCLVFLLGY